MFRKAKSKASKILAGFLAVLMLLSIIPVGVMFQGFAAEVETTRVKLPAGVAATVTLTDDNDASKVFTAKTNDSFEAVFEKLDDTTTYTAVVSEMELYKDYTKTNVVASADTAVEILATDLTEKDVQTISFSDEYVTKNFGDEAFVLALSNAGAGTGAKTYTSTKETVAKVDSNGVVTLTGAGTATIKVKIAADGQYKAAEDFVILNVGRADNAIYYKATEVNWVYKEINSNPLTIKDGAVGTVAYSSSDPSVATVDATTGIVTVVKPGSAVITATFTADLHEGNYNNSQASYTVVATKKAGAISYENTSITAVYGDGQATNPLTKAEGVTGTITYGSSNPSVVAVNVKTGEYTIVGAGEATITANLANDDIGYEEASASYTVTVAKKENALSFASSSQVYTYGDTAVANKLTVAFEELHAFNGPVTYTSSDSSVVSVNSATGAITILKAGTVTITASIKEEANYAAASASYTVTVNKKNISFEINKEIDFGQDDPVITDDIKNEIAKSLVNGEDKNTAVVDRVAGRISYKYENTPAADKNRTVGTYAIKFSAENDECYSFAVNGESTLKGTLTVSNSYDVANGVEYTIEGINSDRWGSETNKVYIKVTDENKYSISATDDHKNDWTEKQLEFSTPEDNTAEHVFYIKDLTTNRISAKKVETFGIDGTNPAVNEFDFKVRGTSAPSKVVYYLSFGTFCNEEVDVTVSAADTGFASGVDSITLYYNGIQYGAPKKANGNMATFTLSVEEFATLKTISARATDKVGNISEMTYLTSENSDFNQSANSMIQLEQIAAEISVDYAEATSVNGGEKWYGNDVAFDVKVSDVGEQNSGIRAIWATINGTEIEIKEFIDADGKVITPYTNEQDGIVSDKAAYYFIDKKTEVVSFNLNTDLIDVPAKPNGKYIVEIYAVDNAGTIVKNSEEIVVNIDRDAPSVVGFQFKAINVVEDGKPFVSAETYGYFFTRDTQVVVTAKDAKPTSGIKHIEFYTVSKDGERKDYAPSTVTLDSSVEDSITTVATFTVPMGFKGQLYARAVDNVGHTTVNEDDTPKYFNPNGTAIEDADMHKTHSAASVTLVNDTVYTDANGLPLYKWADDGVAETPDGIPVKLYVKDTFSGIGSITWKVTAPYNATEQDPAGTTTVDINLDSVVNVGSVVDGWTVEATDKNIITEMSKVIYVTNNSNAIEVDLSFNDRALNTSNANTLYFSIDNTVPTIDVTYDNNIPDSEYTTFYKENRVATVTVTERNFSAKDVVFSIVNTDKVIPSVDLTNEAVWTLVENEDPDKTVHVAKIEYAADGDYTFNISYKDNVENAAAAFAPHTFTIDKTIPTITVTYDNNSAMNGNYYKANRTATLVIKEHNFDAKRVSVIGTATDSATGAPVATTFPATSEWKDLGNDTYSATIAYTADSKYTFDVEFNDKADNSIADYTVEEFYIDKTMPSIEFGGVADKSANNGDVAPTISLSDTNYNKDAVTITLTGVNNGAVKYAGGFADIVNGQKYAYNNFEKVKGVDDIYTLTAQLTDMAGNTTTKNIMFSVNRFGSVYDLTELKELIGKYLQTEKEIVFTEINVDSLEREGIKIKLTKNGTPSDLVENVDYTVEATGGDGQWSVYKYTINKNVFADDARYSVSIYSKDAAGNINENIDETKDAEISFGIDKTKPVIVPIDFKSGVQYPVNGKKVDIDIKDNYVLEGVKIYLNDKEVEYTVDGETYTFDVPESDEKQNVKIVAVDAAGNESEVLVEKFLVNTNLFVRWYNNTPLFIGSIIGIVVVVVAIIAFLLFGKKKKKDDKE